MMLLRREARVAKIAGTQRSKQGEVSERRRDEKGEVITSERLESG